MALKILGARPHAPRRQTYSNNATMELPFSLWLYNDEMLWFDHGADSCDIYFVKYPDQEAYHGFKMEIRTSDPKVMKIYTLFMEKWVKWVNETQKNDSINSFLLFLDQNKIPLIHYWDGIFYQSPKQKCFRWFYNNRSQGRLFADSQSDALKRIQKRAKYLDASMTHIRVEEVEFTPLQHQEIPSWILENKLEN